MVYFKDYDDDFEDDDGDEENEDDDDHDDNKPVCDQRQIFFHLNIKCMFIVAIKILSQCFTKHNKSAIWLVAKLTFLTTNTVKNAFVVKMHF